MPHEFEKLVWREDPKAAYAEAVRRVLYAAEATLMTEREQLDFWDLDALGRIPDGLDQLPDLRKINFSRGKYDRHSLFNLRDLAPLRGLSKLEELSLCRTLVQDISVLSGLSNLALLDLSSTLIENISALSGLTSLSSLRLSGKITDGLSSLSNLPSLGLLDLSGSRIVDISALSSLSSINSLDLSRTKITDISALSSLSRLTSLDLSFTKVADISALSGLSVLARLELSHTKVTNLVALSSLSQLTILELNNTKVTDISVLSSLPNLVVLGLTDTQVTDISVLQKTPRLMSLDLSDTNIADISVLLDLPIFLNEEADYLQFGETDVTRTDRKLDLLSRLDPDRCAIETVQYLKGTHPEFQSASNGTTVHNPAEALIAACPVEIVEEGGRLVAHDRGAPQRLNQTEKIQRLAGQVALTNGLIEEAASAQVPSAMVRRLERYLEAISVEEPIYFVIDPPILMFRGSLTDSYVVEGLDTGLVDGFRHLIEQHEEIKPLFLPASDDMLAADEILPAILPDVAPESAIELVDDVLEAVQSPDAREAMSESIVETLKAVKELVEVATEQLENRPSLMKRGMGALGGILAQISKHAVTSGTTYVWVKWVASPAGIAFFARIDQSLAAVFQALGLG